MNRTIDLVEDTKLAHRLASGDGDAWTEFYTSYSPYMLGVAMHFTRNPASAEDVVQSAMLRIYRSISKWSAISSLRTWCAAIVKNVYLTSIRNKLDHAEYVPIDAPDVTILVSQERLVYSRIYISELSKLFPHAMSILKSRHIVGLSPEQIPELSKKKRRTSVGAYSCAVSRQLRIIRSSVEKMGLRP